MSNTLKIENQTPTVNGEDFTQRDSGENYPELCGWVCIVCQRNGDYGICTKGPHHPGDHACDMDSNHRLFIRNHA